MESFSVESAYREWKQAKKAWDNLTRNLIVQNGEPLQPNFLNQLIPHLAL